MNHKKLLLAATMLVGLHTIETPVYPTINNTSPTVPTLLTPTVIVAGSLYIGYNFLTRQNFLVSKKFPQAQAWYDALAKKYPQANFDKIYFIQRPESDPISDMIADIAKTCSWTSSYHHIYMKKDELTEINHLYKKFLDGYPLDDEEVGKLAGYEFTLLHEAGHIKNNDAQTLLASIFVLLGTSHVINVFEKKDIDNTQDIQLFSGVEFLGNNFGEIKIPGALTTFSTGSFIAALAIILRYQETNADKFALEAADLQALQGGLATFENDEIDPLYDIENKTLEPHIPTNSYVGKFFQTCIGSIECIVGYAQLQYHLVMKSTKTTRWIFDLLHNQIQQGPSVRAQAIKSEIAKRQETN